MIGSRAGIETREHHDALCRCYDATVRTTVNIDEHLLRRAKELAARSRRPLGEVVDDALRVLLTDRHHLARPDVELPTYGGSGLQPGVDLEDRESLAALLGDDASASAPR